MAILKLILKNGWKVPIGFIWLGRDEGRVFGERDSEPLSSRKDSKFLDKLNSL